MFKKYLFIILFGIITVFPRFVQAQSQDYESYSYEIAQFDSDITIQKDTSLKVVETIKVNFPDPRHGIYRIIPVTYSAKGKTINAKLKVEGITDENGNSYPFERGRLGQSVSLKIGDSGKTITGLQTYVITYSLTKVLQRYETHDELYWNVTGNEWDTDILNAGASVRSDFASITGAECFAGRFGGTDRFCTGQNSSDEATFSATTALGSGRDFTIVVALDKNNQLSFPSKVQNGVDVLLDNWGYLVSVLPFIVLSSLWYKKGRDKKYEGDNIYYEPKIKKVITKPLFVREFLPTVYYPIQGFSPSQIGTIVDEKVDIHDIVSEITELARLGYLRIEKVKKERILGEASDFAFIKLDKEQKDLEDYQKFLIEKLFAEDTAAKTIKEIEKIYGKDEKKLKETLKVVTDNKYVLLSSLKNNFYKHLDKYKDKLYNSLEIDNLFDGRPDKVKSKWIGIFIGLEAGVTFLLFKYLNATGNPFPLFVSAIWAIPSFFFAYSMPRRSAYGYSIYRQIKGLAFYLDKGKWREKIAEKHLFFESMLPIAISLGIVDKLAKDMQSLGVSPPSYFGGVVSGSLANDIRGFETSAANTFVSAPGGKWSGSSFWSGGSGFGGGGSGGGFGGGGGGSW